MDHKKEELIFLVSLPMERLVHISKAAQISPFIL